MSRAPALAIARALLVVVLAVSAVSMASPCADDLLVEVGASADQCVGADGENGADPPPAPTAVCPCACHVAFDVNGGASPAPVAIALDVAPRADVRDLAATPARITHPPQG